MTICVRVNGTPVRSVECDDVFVAKHFVEAAKAIHDFQVDFFSFNCVTVDMTVSAGSMMVMPIEISTDVAKGKRSTRDWIGIGPSEDPFFVTVHSNDCLYMVENIDEEWAYMFVKQWS